jgi:hypothetical protein
MPKESEPTIRDVLEAIHSFANQTEQRMVTKDYLEERLQKFQTTMVTKSYLDDKLANLRGDLIIPMRRPDRKVDTLVDVLHEKRVITDADVERVASSSR